MPSAKFPPQVRLQAIKMFNEHVPVAKIAEELDISVNTLRYWIYKQSTANRPTAKAARELAERNELLRILDGSRLKMGAVYSMGLETLHRSLADLVAKETVLEVGQMLRLAQVLELAHKLERGANAEDRLEKADAPEAEVEDLDLKDVMAENPFLVKKMGEIPGPSKQEIQ